MKYLAAETGLGKTMEDMVLNTHKKRTTSIDVKEKRFWSRVELETVMLSVKFYSRDFLLFGYSVESISRTIYLTDRILDLP